MEREPEMTPRFWIGLPLAIAIAAPLLAQRATPGTASSRSPWPAGKRAAVSLSFDDARASQLSEGLPVFAESNTKVTFFLTAGNIGTHAADWRRAAGAGHEMGNHTVNHPCSGNFAWSAPRALEDATLSTMRTEMTEASSAIEQATGVRPVSFAYPCGQTFVGRGRQVASYVPVVSELFVAGRGWLNEGPNDPVRVDLAQVFGYPMDDVEFEDLRPAVDDAIERGQWLVLAGHDIGAGPGHQVTRVSMLRALLAYIQDPSRGVWVDTIGHVAAAVKRAQE
jgi:peptidoglycan/xylan/chitin deacetylase (PgdA/CDA1 family)